MYSSGEETRRNLIQSMEIFKLTKEQASNNIDMHVGKWNDDVRNAKVFDKFDAYVTGYVYAMRLFLLHVRIWMEDETSTM